VHFVLLQFVLPAVSGESTVEGAVESLIGCEDSNNPATCGCGRVGGWIDSIVPTGGLGTLLCDMALTGAAQAIHDELNKLNFSGVDAAHYNAGIAAVLADDDLDLVTDTLQGSVTGEVVIAGGSAAFTGSLRGIRAWESCGEQTDGQCEAGYRCQSRPKALNDCETHSVCALPPL
jgi:hypothetical protein